MCGFNKAELLAPSTKTKVPRPLNSRWYCCINVYSTTIILVSPIGLVVDIKRNPRPTLQFTKQSKAKQNILIFAFSLFFPYSVIFVRLFFVF